MRKKIRISGGCADPSAQSMNPLHIRLRQLGSPWWVQAGSLAHLRPSRGRLLHLRSFFGWGGGESWGNYGKLFRTWWLSLIFLLIIFDCLFLPYFKEQLLQFQMLSHHYYFFVHFIRSFLPIHYFLRYCLLCFILWLSCFSWKPQRWCLSFHSWSDLSFRHSQWGVCSSIWRRRSWLSC